MEKKDTYLIIVSIAAMAVIMAACGGGGGGGGGGLVVQELSLDAPPGTIFSSLAWDGTTFWAHSGFSITDSVIYSFNSNGSLAGTIRNPLFNNYYIQSMEYGDNYLWALARRVITSSDRIVFQMDTSGSVASSFLLPSNYGSGIAYADSLVWAPATYGSLTSNTVAMFQPVGGSQISTVLTLTSTSTQISGFCEGGGYLWFLDASAGGMFKFDKTTGSEVNFTSLSQWGGAITWDGSYLWMSRAPARIDAYDFP